MTITPVIMSGGAGTRLWPLSTDEKPKQFHALFGTQTLLQNTLARFCGDGFRVPLVIGSAAHRHLLVEQTQIVTQGFDIVLEPEARNTAFTAAVAALWVKTHAPDTLVLLTPADHIVADTGAFVQHIKNARVVAADHIVTFGMTPTRQETGYGYIRTGDAISDGVVKVDQFLEKPDLDTAEILSTDGKHLWNAGVFLFAPDVMIAELEKYGPDILQSAERALDNVVQDVLDPDAVTQSPKGPVDTVVMENTNRAATVPCDVGWADVGSFDELWRLSDKDAAGNVIVGPVVAKDCHNCLFVSADKPIAVQGMHDQILINGPGGVLHIPKGQSQSVKALRSAAMT